MITADDVIEANPMLALLALAAYRAAKADGAAAGLEALDRVQANYGRTTREAVEVIVTDIAAEPAAWGIGCDKRP